MRAWPLIGASMKTMFPPGLAILASVHFILTTLLVGTSTAQGTEDMLQITLGTTQGSEVHPAVSDGAEQKLMSPVGVRPGQIVPVTIQCPAVYAGLPVTFDSPDGGAISAAENLSVSATGQIQCTFQAGSSTGLCRVVAEIGKEQLLLQFFILHLDNPQTNPGQLQVVN
jgi:hypothetical protein